MPQARKSTGDGIAEISELAEFAADLLADARSLRDRVTELENDGMEIPAVVDTADRLFATAAAATRALAGRPTSMRVGTIRVGRASSVSRGRRSPQCASCPSN